jgi:hypothetical protein
MKHYISSENCEKEIKEILCVPEKEKCVSTFRIECKRNKRYVNEKKILKVVVDERKNSISRVWT